VIVTVAEAAAALAAGEIVAIPTDTVYGLAVDPGWPPATDLLFAVKERPGDLALPVLVAGVAAAEALSVLDATELRLMERYWPGALTLVVRRSSGVQYELGGDASTIGLRCPAHPLALDLLAVTGPLAVTSANHHREPPCQSAGEVTAAFGGPVHVLDGGTCDGPPSTVVAVTAGGVVCLREGAVSLADIERVAAGGMWHGP
jgi:tRNA threonylcarbamoyl adenosine modification protein (Sua5/YciO/YrdC/YwlC family)